MWDWLQGLSGGAPAFIGSLTGAGIGLIALVIGALFNAHLNRRRDDRLRREEAVAVAMALQAELKGVHRTLTKNAEATENKDAYIGGDLAQMVHIMPLFIGKLGLLNTDCMREVIDAYLLIEQHSSTLMLLGATYKETFPGRYMMSIPPFAAKNVVSIDRKTAKQVEKALTLLKEYEPRSGD